LVCVGSHLVEGADNMSPPEPHAIPFRPLGEIPLFKEEKEGWKGYIEWEKYPEKKKEVEEIMQKYDFPDVRSALFFILLLLISQYGCCATWLTRHTATRVPDGAAAKDQPRPHGRTLEAVPFFLRS